MPIGSAITPEERLKSLRLAIENKGYVRFMEAHSGLSGTIVENFNVDVDGESLTFDGIWESSLTDSASKGLPDASIVGNESRLHTIDEILNVTTKPVIVDGDTGNDPANFVFLVNRLERAGVSAVIIEDKMFPKRNSLGATSDQVLEDPEVFAQKITAGCESMLSDDFMIIARLESLIAGAGLEDALERAERYIKAGAHGIMIHSKQKSPDEILAFADRYPALCERLGRRPILVSVPTTYNQISDRELAEQHGFNVIIHANQLLRASYMSMQETARTILVSGRSHEADESITPVKEIFSAVGYDQIIEDDEKRAASTRPPVIIPAAGRSPEFQDTPPALVNVAGRPVIEHQLEVLNRLGLSKAVVVRGHSGQQFDSISALEDVELLDFPDYDEHRELHSILQARDHMDSGFVMAYSDIIFDDSIVSSLLSSGADIVLAMDSSYRYHQHEVDKKLDLVRSNSKPSSSRRQLSASGQVVIEALGKNLDVDEADHEFIGLAYFSAQGARVFKETFDEIVGSGQAPFHEAKSVKMASFTDLLSELIDRGVTVHGQVVHKGWIEIHNASDVEAAEKELAIQVG